MTGLDPGLERSEMLVVIASFRQEAEARTAREALSAAAIESVVGDDVAVGGRWIGVAVHEADAGRALGVLEEIWGDEAARAPLQIATRSCPDCGSGDVRNFPRVRILAAATLLLLTAGALTGQQTLFLLTLAIVAATVLAAPNRRCAQCGERWREGATAVEEDAVETPDVPCPGCGSSETSRIDRRRESAITLLVNLALPPLVVLWPFLHRRRCSDCRHEW